MYRPLELVQMYQNLISILRLLKQTGAKNDIPLFEYMNKFSLAKENYAKILDSLRLENLLHIINVIEE